MVYVTSARLTIKVEKTVEEQSRVPFVASVTGGLVSMKDAEEMLGVSRQQLYKYRVKNRLPEVRIDIGKQRRIYLRECDVECLQKWRIERAGEDARI